MSSCLDGAAGLVGGIVALGAGAALGAVFGGGWLLYQSGALVVNAVNGVNQAVEDKVAKDRLEAQMRRERAETSRKQIVQMYEDFSAELESELGQPHPVEVVAELQVLLSQTKLACSTNADSTEKIEGSNISAMVKLDKAVQRKNSLLQGTVQHESMLGQYLLSVCIADLQSDLRKEKSHGETKGVNVSALSPEQHVRMQLRQRYEEAAFLVRFALENENRRANAYPVSTKLNKSLHRIFDGMEHRIAKLNNPAITNGDLRDGIRRLEDCMELYRHVSQVLDDEEAEFQMLYSVYSDVQKALEVPSKKPHEFTNLAELRIALDRCNEQVQRAQYCAKIYSTLGVDAYLCLAFDTEMRAMGYSVLDSRQLMKRVNKSLNEHKCSNGITIPVYDIPNENAVTQLYNVDQHCNLQLIVHADGTTTLQTLMHGNDAEQTVQTQRRHCDRATELAARLKKNWFVRCELEETESAEKIHKSMMGIEGDYGIRRTEHKGQRELRYQRQ